MAAMKPRTGDGPLEATKEGRGIVMRVPLEGGGRLVVELSAIERDVGREQKLRSARRHLAQESDFGVEGEAVAQHERISVRRASGQKAFRPRA